jgi:hypothetical protein
VQAAAADECLRATGGDHLRGFQWKPEYGGQNWTFLLKPLYTTYYLDDDSQPQPVFFHGQFGRAAGSRRASMRRAQQASIWTLVVALVIFAFSLIAAFAGVAIAPLLAIGGIGLALAAVIGVCAVIPVVIVWRFNRRT